MRVDLGIPNRLHRYVRHQFALAEVFVNTIASGDLLG